MLNKQVILGTLLGDSSLQTFTNGNSWRLRFIQKDPEYIHHLYDIFKPFVKTPPRLSHDGLGNYRWYFNTIVISELDNYASAFYYRKGNRWIKRVPQNLDLTPELLAYWFMDDGSKKSNAHAYYLCTDSFTLEQIKYLGSLFKTTWGIHISYHKKGLNYRIYIPVKHANLFKSLIKDFIIDSMSYKL